MRLQLLILLGSAVFITSCRKGMDDDSEVSDMTLTLSPTIYGQTAPRAAAERSLADVMAEPGRIIADAIAKSRAIATRAIEPSFTKSKWDNGDKFSVFLTVERDGKVTPISFVGNVYNAMRYDNLLYTYNGTQFTTSGKSYYPYRRAAVDIYGIYPYDAELGQNAAANESGSKRDKSNPAAYPWNVFESQNIQGNITGSGNKTVNQKFNIEQSDLLYSIRTGVLPNNAGSAQPLIFKHLMSKIFVKLLVPKEFNGNILDATSPIISAKLLNTYLAGLVDFRADSVYVKRAENATPITMRPCGSAIASDEGTYYYYECVAVPQNVESGKNLFQIQVKYTDVSEPASFIMRLDKGMGLYSGREHTLDLVFDSKVGLRLNGSYIKDWVEGDGGGGIVVHSDSSPAANSYVVSPGDELLLNSFLAGNDVVGISSYSQKLRSSVKSVKLLWQTKAGHVSSGPLLISSINATQLSLVRIKTNAAATAGGNAVVAAYSGIDGTGEILWSWHIWVTPQKIELQTYGDKFVASNGNGHAIMDRNLGALSATGADGSVKTGGLLYQWGRKDAFTGVSDGGASAIEVYDIAGTVTTAAMGSAISGDNSFKFLTSDGDNLAGSIANPMTFYYANGDWTNSKIDGLWSNYGTHKSVFDPCPSGYRVASNTAAFATGGTWADLGDNGGAYGDLSGIGASLARTYRELGGAPVYGYSGWRGNGGALTSAGIGIGVHSSGEQGAKRVALDVNLATTNPFSIGGKAAGLAVRCVQDASNDEHLTILAQKSIPAAGGSAKVRVYTNRGGAWSATVAGGAGFSLSQSSGNGNGSFDVIATSAGTVGRTATVTVKNAFGTLIRTAKVTQVPATVVIAGTEWCNFNLTGDDGQSVAIKLTTEPQEYGKFFKWGDGWVYGRESSSTDGDWTGSTSGASTTPDVSYTGGVGYDYMFGLSGGRASGDPCQKLGAEYHTPTRAQWDAVYGSGSKWGAYQGVNGVFVGANAHTCDNETIQEGCIFLPTAGYRDYSNGSQNFQGNYGFYWSSSVRNSSYCWNCYFNSDGVAPDDYSKRGSGFSVRCVRSTASQLALSAIAPGENVPIAGKTYTIAVGATGAWSTSEITNATVTPRSGTGGNLTVKITIASNAGAGRPVSVKFSTTSGTPAQSVTWSGAQYGTPQTVTIAGTKWTTTNLTGSAGTNTGHAVDIYPHSYGMCFKWGTSFVYQRESATDDGGRWGAATTGAATTPAASSPSGNGYDYVGLDGGTNPGDPCQKLGANYKTPTRAQWQALDNAGAIWGTYKGIEGRFFGAKASSCDEATLQDGCIFLPASGYRHYSDGTHYYQGSGGYYWSSTVFNATNSLNCRFNSSYVDPNDYDFRGSGCSVRCIQE